MKKRRKRRRSVRRDFDRGAFMKQIDREQRSAHRQKIKDLHARIRAAIRRRESEHGEVSSYCRNQREAATERAERLRAELRETIRGIRLAARGSCARARSAPNVQIALLRGKLAEELRFAEEMRRIERGNRARRPGVASARVRRSESDDEVRQNIPPELIPLFERVKRSIHAEPRRSRTEAFLEYVEEHPGEELEGIDDRTDALVRELERRQRSGRDPRRRFVASSRGNRYR